MCGLNVIKKFEDEVAFKAFDFTEAFHNLSKKLKEEKI